MEILVIKEALERNRWNITRSAKELGITRVTLYNKMGEYKLTAPL